MSRGVVIDPDTLLGDRIARQEGDAGTVYFDAARSGAKRRARRRLFEPPIPAEGFAGVRIVEA
ncbi:hypothetical protein ACRAWG_03475 [Methylobacterium sp. P31]